MTTPTKNESKSISSSSIPPVRRMAPPPPPPPPPLPLKNVVIPDDVSYEEKLLIQRDVQFGKMKDIGEWISYAQPWFCDIPDAGQRLMLGFAEDRISPRLSTLKGVLNTLLMNVFIPIEIGLSEDPVPWHGRTPDDMSRTVTFITALFPKPLYAQLEYLFHQSFNERYSLFTTTLQYPIPPYPSIRAQFLMELHSKPFHRVVRYFPSLSHYGKSVGHFLERVNPKLLKTIQEAMVIVHVIDRKWNRGGELFTSLASLMTARLSQESQILKSLRDEEDEYEREDLCAEIMLLNPKTHTHKSLGQKSPREIRLLFTSEKMAAKQRQSELEIWKQMQRKGESKKQLGDIKENKLTSSAYEEDEETSKIRAVPVPSVIPTPKPEWVPAVKFPPADSAESLGTPPTPPPRPPTPPSPPSDFMKQKETIELS